MSGDADAGAAALRGLGEDRALRDRRAVQARGPQGGADGAGDDARGVRDPARGAGGALLPGPAADALPHPDQGARRAAAAGRGAAHARVHDEGRLLLRPRRGGAGALLRAAERGLRADLRPLRAALVPGRVRRRDDGRLRRPRVHGALRRPARTRSRWRPATPPTSRSPRPRRSRSSCRAPSGAPEEVDTPGLAKVEEVSGHLGLPAGAFIKTLPMVVEGRGMVLVLLRGDHRLNEIKLRNALGADFRQARPEEIEAELGPVGYHRPGRQRACRSSRTRRSSGDSYVSGANEPDTHLRGVKPGRDFEFRRDGRAHGRGRRHRARRRHDRDRAGDRGRQHLQARHPLLGAARRHLPRRVRDRAADRDGQLRDRAGADRRRGDRAGRRRARHRLAAPRSRPGRSTSSRWPRPARRSAPPPTASTRSSRPPGSRCSTTSATPAPGRS